jgi:hypothetical protein
MPLQDPLPDAAQSRLDPRRGVLESVGRRRSTDSRGVRRRAPDDTTLLSVVRGRAFRRHRRCRLAAVLGVAVALVAGGIAGRELVAPHGDSAATGSPNGTPPADSTQPVPLVTNGSCAGLSVTALKPPTTAGGPTTTLARIRPSSDGNLITMPGNSMLLLQAQGPCVAQLRFHPDGFFLQGPDPAGDGDFTAGGEGIAHAEKSAPLRPEGHSVSGWIRSRSESSTKRIGRTTLSARQPAAMPDRMSRSTSGGVTGSRTNTSATCTADAPSSSGQFNQGSSKRTRTSSGHPRLAAARHTRTATWAASTWLTTHPYSAPSTCIARRRILATGQ